MKLVLQDGEIFPDTLADHFTISSTSDMHLGVANDTSTLPSAVILSENLIKVQKATEFSRTVAFAQLKTNDVRALDNDVDIVVTGPTNADAKTSIDQIVFKNDTMTAPKTVADSSYSGIALDHVLNVGKDSRIAVTSYVPDVLKVAGHVAPATIVLPSPINTALIDPVAIQQEAVRYSTELQIAKDAVEAQNAANTATTSSDVSLAVARVVAKTLTHPVDLTHIAHVGNAEFKDYVRIEKVLTVGDASNTLSAIRHSATDLAIDAIDGTPGNIELNTVGFHVGGGTRVSLTHGGIVGAWDILDVSQYNDVNPDAPGIIRSRAIVLGQTEAGAATDHAIVKANEGISVVEVDNGSFATYTALNLAALKVWNGALKGQLILDFLGVLDADTRISSLGSDFKDPTNAAATVIHTTSVGGRLNTDAFLEPVGLRIGGVDVSRVQPGIPDPVHGLNVSEKVTVPTFKVMAEVDKYFELSSHPGSGAMVIHSVEGNTATLLPSLTSLDVTPARLRLVDVASGSYTELVGGNDELAVSVPQIKFVGGMRMTEIVKDLKLTGCEQITLDTCTLDASSTANTLAVSNDIISLGSKVSIAAESIGNVRIGPTPDITVRADDTMALQARNDITLRLNDGTKWNEYAFSSRFDGALLLNGHDIDIIPKDVLSGS
jgi:3D (Asp-Asp-Asp) domain-containing protein